MVPDLLFYQFLLVALVLIYCMIHVGWPDNLSATSKIMLRLLSGVLRQHLLL